MPEVFTPKTPQKSGGSAPTTAEKADKAQKTIEGRVPPHSPEAEKAVLAGILTRPRVLAEVVSILSPEDFYIPAHKIIYATLLDMDRKNAPFDLAATAVELKNTEQLEKAGGMVYLAELVTAEVSGANAEYYAGVVRENAMRRDMIDACAENIRDCFAPGQPTDEVMAASEQRIFAVSQRTTGKDFETSASLVETVFEQMSNLADSNDVITGLTTGYEKLNRLTAGLQKSDLIIIAARPAMGKTAFAMCLALNAAIQQDAKVAVFSLEMSKEQIMARMLAVQAKVDVSKMRRPSLLRDEDWQRLGEAADVIRRANLFIDDTPALSTTELRARARRLKADKGLDLVVIDYLQLMRAGHKVDSRELEISEISRTLKGLAKELNIPVIALSQLNRKVEERKDNRPILSDLRESGAIEQDADMIMFIYRDDVYKFSKPADRPVQGTAEIIIGKQRNGPVGVAELMYLSPFTAFVDMNLTYSGSEDSQ